MIAFLTLLADEAIVVADVSDNRYLECAVAGGADYLIAGDKKHLLSNQPSHQGG